MTLVKWDIGLWSEIPKEKDCDFDSQQDYAKSDADDVTSAVDEFPDCFQLAQYHQFKEECANGDEISIVTSMTSWIPGTLLLMSHPNRGFLAPKQVTHHFWEIHICGAAPLSINAILPI